MINKWVRIERAAELTGYSRTAIYDKISKGVWPEGKIWRRAPDNRKLVNLEEFDRWAESKPIT
ncbi:excisionase [Serratia plymuthica]|nr:excisionase [Serratia plymuthica]